jgi:HlyD family secretion protein
MDKKKFLLITIVLLIIAGMAWYLYQRDHTGRLVASGTIEATEVTVSSRVVGRVVEINVNEGDQVKENARIAEIDAAQLKEMLKSAQSRYQVANDDLARMKKLYADKMVSSQQYEAALSNLQVVEAALATAQIQYNDAIVTAPISGVVLVKAIEKGELASVGTPIVTMADLSKINLMVYLAERDVGKVNLGEEVLVSVDSFPGQGFQGRVVFISEKAEFTPKSIQTRDERVTQVFGIKIEIPNPDLKLKPGMPADAEFQWNSQ